MSLIPFAPFVAASLAIELTPGPNMAYISLLSVQRGRLAGFAAIAGVALGLLVVGLAALLGVSALVASQPVLFEILRWSGVAYLLWLAYDTWRDTRVAASGEPTDALLRESFVRGLVTNLLNPKAYIFYIAVLPPFIADRDAYTAQALVLTLIYVAVATLVHVAIVLGASSVSAVFQVQERRRMLGHVFAGLLVAVAIWVALSTAG